MAKEIVNMLDDQANILAAIGRCDGLNWGKVLPEVADGLYNPAGGVVGPESTWLEGG